MAAKFTMKNFKKWEKVLKDPKLIGEPLRRAFIRTVVFAEGKTKEGTPVDTGRARNSYAHKVDRSPIPRWATWGSNLSYIRALEDGSKPHFPPLAALQPWAARHGFPPGNVGAFLVARAISQRGTKAHHMLRDAMPPTRAFFRKQLRRAGQDIEKEWRRRAR